jgi:hypothetical protein
MDDYARFVLERAKAGIRAPAQDLDRQAAPQRSAWQEQKRGRALNVQTADVVEPEAVLKAKQKAAQDARYAARKAAKKKRRRGY